MKKRDLTSRLKFKEMDKVIQSRKTVHAFFLNADKRDTISFIIAQPVSGKGKKRVDLPVTKIKLKDVTYNKDYYSCKRSVKIFSKVDKFCIIRAVLFAIGCVEKILNVIICYNGQIINDWVIKYIGFHIIQVSMV